MGHAVKKKKLNRILGLHIKSESYVKSGPLVSNALIYFFSELYRV